MVLLSKYIPNQAINVIIKCKKIMAKNRLRFKVYKSCNK